MEIREHLIDLEYLADTEIIGEDSRHLLNDVHRAKAEQLHINPDTIEELWEIKSLYDRLKAIKCSLRCLQGTIERADEAAEEAMEAINYISREIEDANESDDL
jgi:predicted translin family RNA/ssDNA-binding protein